MENTTNSTMYVGSGMSTANSIGTFSTACCSCNQKEHEFSAYNWESMMNPCIKLLKLYDAKNSFQPLAQKTVELVAVLLELGTKAAREGKI